MKVMQKLKKPLMFGAVGTLTVASQSALAVVPPEVTAAFAEATADVQAIGALTVVAIVAIAVFGYLKAVIIS